LTPFSSGEAKVNYFNLL